MQESVSFERYARIALHLHLDVPSLIQCRAESSCSATEATLVHVRLSVSWRRTLESRDTIPAGCFESIEPSFQMMCHKNSVPLSQHGQLCRAGGDLLHMKAHGTTVQGKGRAGTGRDRGIPSEVMS